MIIRYNITHNITNSSSYSVLSNMKIILNPFDGLCDPRLPFVMLSLHRSRLAAARVQPCSYSFVVNSVNMTWSCHGVRVYGRTGIAKWAEDGWFPEQGL